MFCVILQFLASANGILFILTNSPIFWYAILIGFALSLVVAFVDVDLKRKTTRFIVLVVMLIALWYAYRYGCHIAGLDWEIISAQCILLTLTIGYDSIPARKKENCSV